MNKGFGNEFNKKNNNQNKNLLVEDIELSAQTKRSNERPTTKVKK